VKGTSSFAADFSKRGPRDAKGRSLYEFDLQTRMMKYPCSFLIYSEAWDSMPAVVQERAWKRLWDVLNGNEQGKKFSHLSAGDRRAILEIITATKKGLPDYWRQEPDQADLR
jgi:hypothetical protein